MLKKAFLVLFMALFCAGISFAQDEPKDAEYNFDIAEGYYKKGRYEEAIAYYKKAVQINPLFSEAYEKLANCYTSLGDPDNSAKNWKNVFNVQQYNRLVGEGQQLERQGSLRDARAKYREAYDLIPAAKLAKDLLARVSAKIGELPIGEEEDLVPPEDTELELPHPYLDAPVSISSGSILHNLVFVNPIETAKVLPKGEPIVKFGLEYNAGSYKSASGSARLVYDGTMTRTTGEIRYGLQNDLEIFAKLYIGDFSEQKNTTFIKGGNSILEDNPRPLGLDKILVGVKYRFTPDSDHVSAVSFTAKLPFADPASMLSTTVPDIGLNFIRTDKFKKTTFHLNAGFVMPGDEDEIFLDDVDIKPFITFGAASVINLGRNFYFLVQLQGNTNAFNVADYSGIVLTDHIGLRWHTNSILLEGTLGNGLTQASADFFGTFDIGFSF